MTNLKLDLGYDLGDIQKENYEAILDKSSNLPTMTRGNFEDGRKLVRFCEQIGHLTLTLQKTIGFHMLARIITNFIVVIF